MPKKEKEAEQQTKLRLRIKSYDHKLIDSSSRQIIDIAVRNGAEIIGPIPLPTRRSVYTVNRSPHADKKSREQFETRIHKRLIDIHNSSPRTIDALIRIELPAGVDIEIKT